VSLDFVVYLFMLFFLNLGTELSKGVGFSCGALFAYFANRTFTFKSSAAGLFAFALFWVLYIVTLLINILVNEFSLSVFGKEGIGIGLSLFIATAVSALINFIGMKYLIFKSG